MEKCFLSSAQAQHSSLMIVHSWLLFVHFGMQWKFVCSPHPLLTLIYITGKTSPKSNKKKERRRRRIAFEIQLCTHALERAHGGAHAHKFLPGLVWSGLVWSQSSSPASDWSCEGWATLREVMRKVALVPSPLSYQFLSSQSLFVVVYCPPTNMFSS
jgi:hypothetical protein